jgi:hypothetical protein
MIDPNEMSHELFWQQVGRCGRSDIDALMEAEQETRAERIQTAFERGQMHAEQAEAAIDQRLFTQMWLGQDLEQVNREWHENLTGDLQTIKAYKQDSSVKPRYGLYDLSRNARLLSLYFCFGPNGCVEANRLTPDNRRLLVELLWWRTMEKNDIAITRRSTWWLAGSENHDLNSKTTNLLASLIFANDRNYANKPLPNHGYGCAPGYHKAGFNPRAVDDPSRIGTGRADWSDGKTYTAADHYQAWVTFLTEYFAQRARRGFFLENGSPGYMRYTISYILLVYNFCPDTVLREQVRVFLDLFWADWALQQLGGLRGGPKTRHHGQAGQYDAMSDWARFYLGGPGLTGANYAQQLLGDYAWPALIWELVLDREGLGSFAYVARGVGEEEPTCPRPMGVERTMTGDCASRMVKYSWVTPDYVLGTQMDHPMAIHNHLSSGGRWQGLITSNVNARIATVSLAQFPGKTKPGNEYSVELMYHSAQDKNVLITQQKRRWMQINPDWFPAYESIYDVPFGLYIGTGWTTRTEARTAGCSLNRTTRSQRSESCDSRLRMIRWPGLREPTRMRTASSRSRPPTPGTPIKRSCNWSTSSARSSSRPAGGLITPRWPISSSRFSRIGWRFIARSSPAKHASSWCTTGRTPGRSSSTQRTRRTSRPSAASRLTTRIRARSMRRTCRAITSRASLNCARANNGS